MAYKQFQMVPDSRAFGSPNPPADVDNLSDTVAVTHTFNGLNKAYGTVDPAGGLDSTAGINAGLAACTAGQRYFLPAGRYLVSAPLLVPPGVMFEGEYANEVSTYVDGYFGTCLIVSASWAPATVGANTFSGVISILGQTVPSPNYVLAQTDPKVRGIYIDGHLGPAGVTGVQCFGNVARPHLERVDVSHVTGNAFDFVNDNAGNGPDAARLNRCTARNAGGIGFNVTKISDSTLEDCLAESCAGDGFRITNMSNGKLIGCRGEHNGSAGVGNGFTWICTQASTGSGGFLMVGCSSDRNEGNGLDISSSNATGVPVTISGCDFRRDGRNGNSGGGNLSGVYVHAFPGTVLMDGVSTWPGVDDDSTGASSPQNGLRIAGCDNAKTFIYASGCWFQGQSNGVSDDGSAAYQDLGPSGRATGPTSAPVPKTPFNGAGSLVLYPTGDGTGAADSLKIGNAQALLATLGVPGTIVLAHGTWNLQSPVAMTQAGQVICGVGPGTVVQQGSSWAGTALFQIGASNVQVRGLTINVTTSTAVAFQVTAASLTGNRITGCAVTTASSGAVDFQNNFISQLDIDHSSFDCTGGWAFSNLNVHRSSFNHLTLTARSGNFGFGTIASGGGLSTTDFDTIMQFVYPDPTSGVRTVPGWQLSDNTGSGKNIDGLTFKRVTTINEPNASGSLDNTQFIFDIACQVAGSGGLADAITFICPDFGACIGGGIRCRSVQGLAIIQPKFGNMFNQGTPTHSLGNSMILIGQYPGAAVSQSPVITGFVIENSGTLTLGSFSHIECDAATTNLTVTGPDSTGASTNPAIKINANGALGVVISGAQSNLDLVSPGTDTMVLGNGAVSIGGTGLLQLQAATAYPGGFALQNGTPSILTWTAPNDGRQHRVQVLGLINVSSGETGGAVKVSLTDPGGNAHNFTVSPGGSGAGGVALSAASYVVEANTAVTLAQSSALTAGAAVIWAELWAS